MTTATTRTESSSSVVGLYPFDAMSEQERNTWIKDIIKNNPDAVRANIESQPNWETNGLTPKGMASIVQMMWENGAHEIAWGILTVPKVGAGSSRVAELFQDVKAMGHDPNTITGALEIKYGNPQPADKRAEAAPASTPPPTDRPAILPAANVEAAVLAILLLLIASLIYRHG